jgi:hypothetical protein
VAKTGVVEAKAKVKEEKKVEERPKQDYEIAVESFLAADEDYKKAETEFMDGTTVEFIVKVSNGDADKMKENWRKALEELHHLLNVRNAALKTAQISLRSIVVLAETSERGIEGKPTVERAGPFSVSSVTSRTFDAEDLENQCKAKGVWDELLKETTFDSKGAQVPILRKEWVVEYEPIKAWLQKKGLTTVLISTYHEIEKTPMVKGPKKLAFIGDKVDGKD